MKDKLTAEEFYKYLYGEDAPKNFEKSSVVFIFGFAEGYHSYLTQESQREAKEQREKFKEDIYKNLDNVDYEERSSYGVIDAISDVLTPTKGNEGKADNKFIEIEKRLTEQDSIDADELLLKQETENDLQDRMEKFANEQVKVDPEIQGALNIYSKELGAKPPTKDRFEDQLKAKEEKKLTEREQRISICPDHTPYYGACLTCGEF